MSDISTLDRQLQELDDQSRLGAAVGSPVAVKPIPFRHSAGVFSLLIFGLLLLGIAAMSWNSGNRGVANLQMPAGFGLLCVVASIALLVHRALSRGSLTLHENGFLLDRRGKRTGLLFAEIDSLALREDERVSYGTPVGMLRRATVRGAAGTIRLTHFCEHKRPDDMGALLGKLAERLADAAETRLRAGGSLDGGGWSLGPDGLRRGSGELPVPISSLARVGLFEHQVSLWKEGDERPFFSVPAGGPNALVLGRVVGRRLRDTPETARAGELGRVLFEQRSRKAAVLAVVGGLAMAVFFFWLAASPDQRKDQLLFTALGGVGILCVPFGVHLWTRIGRRHEHGLSMSTLFGRRELLYADIEKMSYSATAHYHNGIYTGTTFVLKAWPASDKPITFTTQSRANKDDLDVLRNDLAERIAAKLHARLAHQKEVPWTGKVRLSKEGVRFETVKFVGRGDEVLVKFSEQPQYGIARGTFQLSVPGRKGVLLRALCSAENFYPGLVLFQHLAAEAGEG